MPNRLLRLYIRSVTASARLTLRLAGEALKVAGDAVRPSPSAAPEKARTTPDREPRRATTRQDREAASPPTPTPPADGSPEVDYDAEPPTPLDPHDDAVKTLDDEPELVGEYAEPGAEDGAGASLAIDEPWEGFDGMDADDVIIRLEQASPEEVAIVELYERNHKQRSTVLSAAERRLQAERA